VLPIAAGKKVGMVGEKTHIFISIQWNAV